MNPPIDFENMPVYVINLDRRTDRWNLFSSQPYLSTFKGLQRYSAFDGRKIDVPTETKISVHTRENIQKNFRRSHYEINTVGACGASFSHIGCWEKFLKTDEPYCMILEDDATVFPADFAKAKVLATRLPTNFGVWILGYHPGSLEAKPYAPKSPWSKVNRFTGAHCYIITRAAATALLAECYPIETHIEFYMCAAAKLKKQLILSHKDLRTPQIVEFTQNNDSDTVAQRSCPLCSIPDSGINTHYVLSKPLIAQSITAVAAILFVGYGLYRSKK